MNTELLDDLGRIFSWQPDPTRYFPTPATEKLRQDLRNSLEADHGVTVLSGSAGAGKTLLLQVTLRDLSDRWAHLAQLSYTSMSGAEILRSVAYAFGMPADHGEAPTPAAWTENRLRHWAHRGEASLLAVDEAQNLPLDALLPLLALTEPQANGQPLLQIILVGLPPLLDVLATPALQASAGAIGPPLSLPPFQAHESAAYITDRLGQLAEPGRPVFSAAAMAEVHARTEGRPGQIHLLCKQLLQMAALADESAAIDAAAVSAQADELGFDASTAPAAHAAHATHAARAAPDAPAVHAAPDAPAAPQGAAPEVPSVAPAVPAAVASPARRNSRILPIFALLLMAAIGAGFFLPRPAPPPAPPAAAAVVTPPAPAQPAMPAPVQPTAQPAVQPAVQPEAAETAEQAAPSEPSPRPPQQLQRAEPVVPAQPLRQATGPAAAAKPAAPFALPTSENPQCAHLLAQLSLGEPLTERQQHTLESTCR